MTTPHHLRCERSIIPDRRCVVIPATALKGAGAIVLARRVPGGLVPFSLRLPHQVYVEDLDALMGPCQELWALPVGVEANWVQIAGRRRWKTAEEVS